MICASRTPGLVLRACREIAAELATEAADPKADLSASDRRAISALSRAIDAEAARVVGAVAPVEAEAVIRRESG